MPFFKSDDMQAWTGGTWFNLDAKKTDIKGFSVDSRNMQKDFAFVAIKAERDGHDFALNAVENGASVIIAERELDVPVPVLVVKNSLKALQKIAKLHRLRYENPVVAITGSCGKTSTKEMLAKLLSWKNPAITEKNYNNEIGVPLTLTQIDMRQNLMAIVEAGVGAPEQMKELAEMIEPDIAVITNVGLTHLERFKEVSAVAKEKAILPANVSENGWCVIHQNLLSWKAFDELPCKKAVIASADAPEVKADAVFRYTISNVDINTIGIDMCVEGGDEFYFETHRMSSGMIENLLLAIAVSLMLGAKEEQLATKIETLKPLPMRGGIVETEKAKFYIDCYNASPTSMRDALNNFAIVAHKNKKVYLLGTMAELGLATHRHHKETGSNIPYSEGDKAILVGTNAEIYKSGLLDAGWQESEITVLATSTEAKPILETLQDCFIFVKGSRVCELEKALPDDVLTVASENSEPQDDASTNNEESVEVEDIEETETSEDIADEEEFFDDTSDEEDNDFQSIDKLDDEREF